ncbi:MAG: HAD family hydrolase [Chloroflexota bacterium]|nr:HAD family hydrolase [Chloroflexota bacterium]
MSHALLLDLDDTLLRNSMEDFLPRYFSALMEAVSHLVPPQEFLRALHHSTQRMMVNTDPSRTNAEVFWYEFEPMVMVERGAIEPVIDRFYEETFATLAGEAEPVEGAQALIAAAKQAGWKVAVATNPVFPLRAIQHRIEWAGLDESQFDFITSYENMTCTKPHPEYFAQIADALGVPYEACVMVGNHLSNDIVGAAELGMQTFWVTTAAIDDADVTPDAQGSLDDLRQWLFGP